MFALLCFAFASRERETETETEKDRGLSLLHKSAAEEGDRSSVASLYHIK